MNSRQRVLRTLRFEQVDRPPFDLMEGCVWPELQAYFRNRLGLDGWEQVIDFLDPDFRWGFSGFQAPPQEAEGRIVPQLASKPVADGLLAQAETTADLARYPWLDPAMWDTSDFQALRMRYPDKALVFCPGWMPLFWSACEAFGVQAALVKMLTQPVLFDAFIQRYHAIVMAVLARGIQKARGWCDLALLGDDFASQQGMMISPALWRARIKPYLAEQVRLLRENGLLVLFHSCGAVRPILPDLVEIGVNALLVFQTTAKDMDAPSIAREFGGKLAFYGGIDVQKLLSHGTPEEVAREVQANVAAFAGCGGYIIANSHHTITTIKGENMLAMCEAARRQPYPMTGAV